MNQLPDWKIPLYKVFWDDRDIHHVNQVLKSGMNWATGPYVQEFEQLAAEYVGTQFGVAFNSGTSALHAMLIAAKITSGDEVIVPSFTFIATANSVLFVGAKPVFADIEEQTFGLDPQSVGEQITRRTRAIMPIHYGGSPCRIKELKELADDHKLMLLEDAAESLGARFENKQVGSFGEQSMISFCGNKVITTGEGGMVLTDQKPLYKRLKLIRSHGRVEAEPYFKSSKPMEYIELGYNWRLSNILAALGVSQIKKIEEAISLRQENSMKLTSLLKGLAVIPPSVPPDCRHVYQMYSIQVTEDGLRDKLADYLTTNGIGTKVYFNPVHLSQFYRQQGHGEGELPVTEALSKRILTLPMYPGLSTQEIKEVASNVRRFFAENS